MIVTKGKMLYYFYTNSRDMIIDEIATEEALMECVEMVGDDEISREFTEQAIRGMMTIVEKAYVS